MYKKDRIVKRRFYYLLIYIFFSILLFVFIYLIGNSQNQLEILNIVSLLQLICSIIVLIKFDFSIFSLPILFIAFSYLFHLGQLPILSFNIDADMPWPVMSLVDFSIYTKGIIFVIKVHFSLMLGILLCSMNRIGRYINCNKELIEKLENVELNRLVIIGKLFVFIGFSPLVFYEMKKLLAYINIGYGNAGIAPPGVVSVIINMFYVGLILILIGKKNNFIYSRNLLIISILIFVLMMISGSRGEKVVRLIVMFSIFFTISYNKKIHRRTWAKYGLVGYLGLSFVNFISDIRSRTFSGYSSLISMFTSTLKNNPIFEAMGEFGGTFVSVCYSLMFFTESSDFLLGSSYIKGLNMVMLNFGGFIDNFRDEIIFVFQFPVKYQYALGGSYIGELYANFGEFGFFFSFFIGILIAVISRKMEFYSFNRQWINYSIMTVMFSRIIWWVRDYFGNMVREVVWLSLAILLLNIILKEFQKSKHHLKGERHD